MAAPGFCVPFDGVALSAATAKTVAGIKPASNKPITITAIAITFDGVTATAVPALIEVVIGTDASNSPGTNSTSVTPTQTRGRPTTAQASAAKTWTAEPTVLTAAMMMRIPPTSGIVMQFPLGREIEGDSTTNKFIGVRVTAAAVVNVSGFLEFEE